MIEWLIQSVADQPGLARGIVPAGLLSEPEQLRLAELKTAKRRGDWLIGRWTAKHLLQEWIERHTGIRPPLDALTIANDPDGAPRIVTASCLRLFDGACDPRLAASYLQSLNLSISHSCGSAFCALFEGARIGADIERVETRLWQFVEDYFTEGEILQVRAAPAGERATLVTTIWSAKESALKVLRTGLSVDTRSVACSIGAPRRPGDWAGIEIVCDRRLGLAVAPMLRGWWRRMDDFVLTVAATKPEGEP
jgi:4'-phosphopantetheinyl transferase